ncbi:hypothetical protein O9K63_00380 [Janibacter cremeus]|uniref:hypothetical protein n=1 Tax=Janibacter cremeus TaxID=1285192 RepID=UPI0023F9D6F6|nr:hypothetical protein [Janibacter cremeus]WEV78206.1 hypothetical protein O9K63_16720 [Janibacter cremeus]WEV78286.1 hypothetical protein O9K63_00380 [Janibacter cremeus]
MRLSTALASLVTTSLIGTLLATAPTGSASAATPAGPGAAAASDARVRVSGDLLSTAVERRGDRQWHAVQVADRVLPVSGEALETITPGSRVSLDVAVPQLVADAAEDGRTLRIPAPVGTPSTHRLDPGDVDAASDTTPSPLGSDLGRATADAALAPDAPELEVTEVVAAVAPAAATYTPATRRITYVAVTPRGLTREPVSTATATGQVASVDSFWRDNSRSTLQVGAPTVRAQYTSVHSCSSAGPFDYWAEAAERLGWTWADNASLVVNLPRSAARAGCGYGYGTIGSGPNDGGMLSVADTDWPVLAHELGHNMSLGHANWLVCPGRTDARLVDDWWPSDCTEYEYEDGFDVMSYSGPSEAAMLSTPQALRVGTLEAAAAVTVGPGTTSVTLAPLSGRTGVRAARVTNSVTGTTYYVEYRTASGRDAHTPTAAVPGVRVLRYNGLSGASVLLDPTPGTAPDADGVLAAGRTFSSHDGRIKVTTVSTSSSDAVVRISNNATLRLFTNTAVPRITGTKGVGKKLTTSNGAWSPTPTSYTYRWKRNGVAITGATARTYTPRTADAGRYLTVTVRARRAGYKNKPATSYRVGIPMHSTTRPYISGTPAAGRTLTARVGAWTPRPSSYRYRWYRNGTRITGATAKTYTVRRIDRGKRIKARATARRTGYVSGSAITYSRLIR